MNDYFSNPVWRMQNLYKIKDKNKNSVNLILNRSQIKILETIQELENKKKPVRLIILKPRQIGCTTFFGIKHLDCAYWNRNQFAAVIAHLSRGVKTIFNQIIKFAYDSIDERIRFKAYNDSANQLSWKKIASEICVTTDGHGITPNMLHITEVARIPNAKEVIGEALEGVPRSGHIIKESTANGTDNYFYDCWKESTQDRESYWTPIFLRWWDNKEYSLPLTEDFQLTEEEKDLFEKYKNHGLSFENIAWRREKIKQGHGDKIDKKTGLSGKLLFQQNYPMNPDDSFIVKQGSVFNTENLYNMLVNSVTPINQDIIGNGYFKQFYPKEFNKEYLISVDVSYGESNDFSSAHIFELKEKRPIATIFGKYIPKKLSEILCKVGKFYNNAMIVVERNTGQAVLSHLIHDEKYDNIYYHIENKSSKSGFPTSMVTRHLFISLMEDAIENNLIDIPDEETIRELLNFGNLGGKIQAVKGHDDRVISLCIGFFVCCNKNNNKKSIQIKKPHGV